MALAVAAKATMAANVFMVEDGVGLSSLRWDGAVVGVEIGLWVKCTRQQEADSLLGQQWTLFEVCH